jgi:Flp pilus assembly protein CpaB
VEHILSSRLLSTRRGTIVLAFMAAMLATVILLAYLSQYRTNLQKAGSPATVLVAKRLIEKNTPGNLVAAEELFVPTSIPRGQLREGAVSDPVALRERVAVTDIYPGQQLTTTDFAPASRLLTNKLARDKRGIAIPADSVHGLIGHVQSGDRVDVYVAFGNSRGGASVSLLMKDVPVLSAPTGTGGGGLASGDSAKGTFILQADDQSVAELAYAADYGRLWLVMRPPNPSATKTRDSVVTAESILLGVRPVVNAAKVRVRGR